MSKLYNPNDRNLAANPSLPKTNSPWRFIGLLVLSGAALAYCWSFFAPDVRLTQPTMTFSPGRVVAICHAINRTANPVALSVRVTIGNKSSTSDHGIGRYFSFAEQDLSVRVPPHTTLPISHEFTLPTGKLPTHAEARLVGRK